ncbi:Flp pilus assembly complex ATPase component TadA [Bradyrhizobium sp. 156]|nr:ATPase, T2SS/T4P/T4SS family [Bradyrhizobium sp. 156]MCK1325372.1 Flp pilus assembly complex ATPase component TadA [Bradyrhizobium sp. 156]
MLRTALGPAIAGFLEDPAIVEVMLNPDGRLWIDRLSSGLTDTGESLSAADGERIVRLVAHYVGAEVHPGSPRISAELPETGERFEGLLPPVVAAPTFAIRKPAIAVFGLDDYVAADIMNASQASALRNAVAARKNILVAGGTSTGKTTLTNALLAEVAKGSDRCHRLILALRAVDGSLEGNSYREIAQGLFGKHRIPDRGWKTDHLRSRTIRLVRAGLRLMRGGYRALLRRNRKDKGERP